MKSGGKPRTPKENPKTKGKKTNSSSKGKEDKTKDPENTDENNPSPYSKVSAGDLE